MTEPALQDPASQKDTKLSVVIRTTFFIALVVIGMLFATAPLQLFGPVVAGSVGLCATGLAANVITMRIFDRRPLQDVGLQANRNSNRNLGIGVLYGSAAAALMLFAPLLAGTGHLDARSDVHFSWASLLFYLMALLVAATGEELIFRGYAFQLLIEKVGPFATILPVSLLFGLAHRSNPNASGLAVSNTVLWGILLGFAFLRSRDLWLPIGLHFGWNAVLPLFGVNLSGLTIEITRYVYRWDLAPIWSGGDYGPEGGLLTTIFVLGLFYALYRAPVKPQTAMVAPSVNDLF